MPDVAWCPLAERNLIKLGCCDPYGRLIGGVNADGERFSDQCADMETKQQLPLNARCVSKATTCQEAMLCTRAK